MGERAITNWDVASVQPALRAKIDAMLKHPDFSRYLPELFRDVGGRGRGALPRVLQAFEQNASRLSQKEIFSFVRSLGGYLRESGTPADYAAVEQWAVIKLDNLKAGIVYEAAYSVPIFKIREIPDYKNSVFQYTAGAAEKAVRKTL